jgi:hypothetical protein
VQLPFILGGLVVLGVVSVTLKILVGIVTNATKSESYWTKMHKLKSIQPIVLLCINICVTTILWALISITSAPEFRLFVEEV